MILDDLIAECARDERLTALFTKKGHHLRLIIIFITRNLFDKGNEMRYVSFNSLYLILFKNSRDMRQIIHLGKQLYPGPHKFFLEVHKNVTKKTFLYLLVDFRKLY